jgi:hypothetical protein
MQRTDLAFRAGEGGVRTVNSEKRERRARWRMPVLVVLPPQDGRDPMCQEPSRAGHQGRNEHVLALQKVSSVVRHHGGCPPDDAWR